MTSNLMEARKTLISLIVEGPGKASRDLRKAAFDNTSLEEPLKTLIAKVTKRAFEVTDDDIAVVLTAGLSEDQIFELVICGAVGQATRQHTNALAALRAATDEV